MDKDKIKKGIGFILLASSIIGGAKGITIEAQTDHTKELCPFVNILGYDHQLKAINRDNRDLIASYEEVDNRPYGFIKETAPNGEEYYISRIAPIIEERYKIPTGYKIEQNERGEDMLIARNANGDIVSILEPTIEQIVVLPEGYEFDENWMAVKKIPASKSKILAIRNQDGELVNSFNIK